MSSKLKHSNIIGRVTAVEMIFFSLNIMRWRIFFTLLFLNLQDVNGLCFNQLRMGFSGVWGYMQPKN